MNKIAYILIGILAIIFLCIMVKAGHNLTWDMFYKDKIKEECLR